MVLDLIEDITIRDGPWHSAPEETMPSGCLDEVDIEVERETS